MMSNERGSTFVTMLVLLSACSQEPAAEIIRYESSWSPDSSVEAYVYESPAVDGNGLTQVMLLFPQSSCGAGAVSWYENDLNVEIEWLDNQTLDVRYPAGAEPQRNVSGEIIGCLDRKVHVQLSER